jgi:hypothetical protein
VQPIDFLDEHQDRATGGGELLRLGSPEAFATGPQRLEPSSSNRMLARS